MMLIFSMIFRLLWSKQQLSSDKFPYSATQTPYVSTMIVLSSDHHFRSTVVSSLYQRRYLLASVTCISHVYNLDLKMLHLFDSSNIDRLHGLQLLVPFHVSPKHILRTDSHIFFGSRFNHRMHDHFSIILPK